MATIAAFRFPPETFVFGRLFETFPEATIEIERVIPTGNATTPYFWADGVSAEEIRPLLGTTEGIEGAELVDTFEGRILLRCVCDTAHSKLFDIIADCDVSLLAAEGTADGWRLTLRGDDQTAVSEFDSASRDAGLEPELCDLHAVTHASSTGVSPVTDRQREALLLAFQRGYFDEPRETTLDGVASELDISRQALASRLRRGYRALIQSYVVGTDT